MKLSRFIHSAACAAAFTLALLSAVPSYGQTTYVNKVRGSNGRDQCLAAKDGRIANDSQLILWDCIPGDLSQTFWYGASNLLHVGGPASQFCVAAYDRLQNASRIGVWQCQPGDPTQTFTHGMYSDITAVGTNFCLGVRNGSNSPGSPIILWSCNKRGNDDQSWSVNRAGGAPTVAAAPQPLPSLAIARPTGNTTVLNYNGTRLAPSLLGPGGHLIGDGASTIVAAGGGNYVDPKTGLLMGSNGSPLLIGYQLITNDGGSIIASGGGNIIASGGGNIIASGGGNIIASGGGNLLASANGFSVYNPAFIATLLQKMNSALLQRSQTQLAQSTTSGIMVNNSANYGAPAASVISPNGGTYHVQSAGGTPAANQMIYVNKVRGSNGRDQCLAVKDGRIANDSRLILWDCIPGDLSQTFWYGPSNLLHVGGTTSQFCVAAYDRLQNASRIGVWQCQPGDPTQTFSPGMYSDIVAAGTNFCLGVMNGSNSPGSPLILWSCNKRGNDDQSWSVNRQR